MIDTKYKGPLTIVAIVIIAVVAYGVLTMQDQRSTTDRMSDAIRELPHGVDKAERELQDRTPGQRLGDDVKDAGDKIKDNTNP